MFKIAACECMWVSVCEWICVLWKSKTNMGLGGVGGVYLILF